MLLCTQSGSCGGSLHSGTTFACALVWDVRASERVLRCARPRLRSTRFSGGQAQVCDRNRCCAHPPPAVLNPPPAEFTQLLGARRSFIFAYMELLVATNDLAERNRCGASSPGSGAPHRRSPPRLGCTARSSMIRRCRAATSSLPLPPPIRVPSSFLPTAAACASARRAGLAERL